MVIELLLRDMFAEPSKETPAIVLAVASFVAVAALPVQDPDDPEAFPVTLPVHGPEKAVAVQVPDTVTPELVICNLLLVPCCKNKLPVPLSRMIELDPS